MSKRTFRVWVIVDEAGELATVAAFPTYVDAAKNVKRAGFPAEYVRTATLTLSPTRRRRPK
jgi:hypothetical protein